MTRISMSTVVSRCSLLWRRLTSRGCLPERRLRWLLPSHQMPLLWRACSQLRCHEAPWRLQRRRDKHWRHPSTKTIPSEIALSRCDRSRLPGLLLRTVRPSDELSRASILLFVEIISLIVQVMSGRQDHVALHMVNVVYIAPQNKRAMRAHELPGPLMDPFNASSFVEASKLAKCTALKLSLCVHVQ